MKRVTIAAIMVAALVFGVVTYATGADVGVTVTARVNPAFAMTIDDTAHDFLNLDLGGTHSAASVITVKSNKLWDFSKGATVDALLVPLLTEGTDVAPGTGKAKGVTDITATYDLDLTGDAAYDLDPATDYSASYTYTAVQQ